MVAAIKKLSVSIFVIDLVILNALGGYLIYDHLFGQDDSSEVQTVEVESSMEPIATNIALATPTPEPQVVEKIVEREVVVEKTVEDTSKDRVVSYVTIPGSGDTLSGDWVILDGTSFYLDKSDYPGLKEVYFEATMRLENGNGKAYLRIYDKDHGIGVNGSDIETSSQNSVIISSSNMNLWEGMNEYAVQARTLAADSAIFESGRLKIVQEL